VIESVCDTLDGLLSISEGFITAIGNDMKKLTCAKKTTDWYSLNHLSLPHEIRPKQKNTLDCEL